MIKCGGHFSAIALPVFAAMKMTEIEKETKVDFKANTKQ